jgi:predicted nucleotidyltransferase
MTPLNLGVEPDAIAEFCRRWKIAQLAVFGSAARGRMHPESDLDLLVTFANDADWTMFDHYRMENELTRLFARDVDLISITALRENPNPIYAKEIIETARTIYAA